jgi:hypothetical protein
LNEAIEVFLPFTALKKAIIPFDMLLKIAYGTWALTASLSGPQSQNHGWSKHGTEVVSR